MLKERSDSTIELSLSHAKARASTWHRSDWEHETYNFGRSGSARQPGILDDSLTTLCFHPTQCRTVGRVCHGAFLSTGPCPKHSSDIGNGAAPRALAYAQIGRIDPTTPCSKGLWNENKVSSMQIKFHPKTGIPDSVSLPGHTLSQLSESRGALAWRAPQRLCQLLGWMTLYCYPVVAATT